MFTIKNRQLVLYTLQTKGSDIDKKPGFQPATSNPPGRIAAVLSEYVQKSVKLAVGILVVLGTVAGIFRLIDWRMESYLQSEQVREDIARRVRPYLIFNQNGSILVDGGGMQYLQEPPEVIVGDSPDLTITVFPKEHMSFCPLIESLTGDLYHFEARRGKGHQWILLGDRSGRLGQRSFPTANEDDFVLRMEILKGG